MLIRLITGKMILSKHYMCPIGCERSRIVHNYDYGFLMEESGSVILHDKSMEQTKTFS